MQGPAAGFFYGFSSFTKLQSKPHSLAHNSDNNFYDTIEISKRNTESSVLRERLWALFNCRIAPTGSLHVSYTSDSTLFVSLVSFEKVMLIVRMENRLDHRLWRPPRPRLTLRASVSYWLFRFTFLIFRFDEKLSPTPAPR
jgi:hypothetical protein